MPPLGDNEHGDGKRKSISRFWAIRQCDSLRSAAIFTDWEDCSFYVDTSENDEAVEYKDFHNMADAVMYILPWLKKDPPVHHANIGGTGAELQKTEGNAAASLTGTLSGITDAETINSTRKRSAGEAFSRSLSQPAKASKTKEDSQLPVHLEKQWQVKFEVFKEFKNDYPDGIIHRSRTEDEKYRGFLVWTSRERTRIRAFQTNPKASTRKDALKVKMLLEEGFKPNPERLEGVHMIGVNLSKWEERFQEAKEWQEKYGTLKFAPGADGYGEKLSRWVAYQRKLMQKDKGEPGSTPLDDERIQRLKDLGLEPKIFKEKYRPQRFQAIFLEKLKEAEAAPLTPIVVRNDNGATESADLPTAGASANAPSAALPSNREEDSVTEQTIAIEAKSPAVSMDRLSSSAIKQGEPTETTRRESSNDEQAGTEGQKMARPEKISGHDKKWETKFQLLKEYKELYGTCAVHKGTAVGKFEALYRYQDYERERILKVQKMQAEAPDKVNEKDTEKAGRLLELGFVTMSGIELQEHCQSIFGNISVWAPKRVAMWEAMFEMLKQYKAINGVCQVRREKQGYDDHLYRWATTMRKQIQLFEEDRENCNLDAERINRLKELGVSAPMRRENRSSTLMSIRDPRAPSWDELFEQLKAFKEEHGHVEVPHRPKTLLRNWIVQQRTEFDRMSEGKNSRLTPDRLAKLTGIGLSVQTRRRVGFDQRAAEWLEYRARHSRDPIRDSGPLGSWVGKTRYKYTQLQQGKPTTMTQEQADKLTAWGFVWDTGIKKPEKAADPKTWEERYAQLLEYKEEHGHVNVPQQYPQLGHWVHRQRQHYSKLKRGMKCTRSMTAEKLEKLKSVGFVFLTRKSPLEPRRDDGGKKKTGGSKKAKAIEESSESSSEEEDDEDHNGYSYSQQNRNPGQYARIQMEFAPWDRYKL